MNSLSSATSSGDPGEVLEKPASNTLQAWLSLAALGLLILATWLLQRPYRGLNHDSVLYTFLALARLYPASLAHDVILRFGSQDSYTVFSPIYAAAIRALDLEPAAALLTFLGQLAYFAAAWALARRVMSARQALLAVGLLIALPSDYGARQDFGYIEGFLTPRQVGEALVLAGLAAALGGRRILCGVCLCAGMLLHPIMAFAGFVMLFCLYLAVPRPRLALALGSTALGVSLAIVLLFPVGSLRAFDATWLDIIDSFGYLFMFQWTARDWAHLCVPTAVLVMGALQSTTPLVRKLCSAALVMAGAGILATLIFCDLLHVVLITQMQPWRCLWLAQVIAVLLLPLIVPDCWRSGSLGRAGVFLLFSAFELRGLSAAPGIVLGAVACVASAGRVTNTRYTRLILFGCGALLIVATLISLLPHALGSTSDRDVLPLAERLVRWLNRWAGDGLLYSLILGVAFWIGERRAPSTDAFLLTAAAVFVCVLSPAGWRSWTTHHYTPALRDRYAQWRALIPEEAEVFWTTSPVGAWYLLQRPDYWAPAQASGDIFSREKAIETRRRGKLVLAALEAAGQRHPPDPDPRSEWHRPIDQTGAENPDELAMAAVCSDPQLSFVVSRIDLGPTSYPQIMPDPGDPDHRLRLYRCADVRQLAAATAESP
jgi:hypothetical protein